ncbi:hypothetical protein Dda_1552 [Drechslerella dactyloides]|uniref:Uncharacterized protein n=1 Tax=Drechslerella dactyloides TaxID=74499 RepID=A0AAD6J1X2_DREDA|nr:hypothetical protein Dda_1552 [Drechslerella dactyloides]
MATPLLATMMPALPPLLPWLAEATTFSARRSSLLSVSPLTTQPPIYLPLTLTHRRPTTRNVPNRQVNTLRNFLHLSLFEFRQLQGAIDDVLRACPELVNQRLNRGSRFDSTEFCRRAGESLNGWLDEELRRKIMAIEGCGYAVYEVAMLRRKKARAEMK